MQVCDVQHGCGEVDNFVVRCDGKWRAEECFLALRDVSGVGFGGWVCIYERYLGWLNSCFLERGCLGVWLVAGWVWAVIPSERLGWFWVYIGSGMAES